jgi:hypothetical protein
LSRLVEVDWEEYAFAFCEDWELCEEVREGVVSYDDDGDADDGDDC